MIIQEFLPGEDVAKLLPVIDSWIAASCGIKFNIPISAAEAVKEVKSIFSIRTNRLFVLKDGPDIVGAIGVILYKPGYTTKIFAQEHYWFVMEPYRRWALRLLRMAEAWAKKEGASHFVVTASALANLRMERVERLLGYKGFKPFEFSYLEEL